MATWTTIPDADLTSGKPGKQSIFRALRDNIDAALSGDPSAPKIQSGAFDDGVITIAKLVNSAVGDNVILSNDALTTTTSLTYVKLKEIKLARDGDYRVSYQHYISGGGTTYTRIYKNGVAVGVEHTTISTSPVTVTEDVTGFLKDDLLQIYAHQTAGTANVQNEKLKSSTIQLFEVTL